VVINPNLSNIANLIDAEDAKGIYLVGSYARGDMSIDSDIDILIITNSTNKNEKKGKYELIYLTEDKLNGENLIMILPMLLEAKSLLNSSFLEELREKAKKNLTNEIIHKYSLNCEDMLDLNKKEIELAKLKKQAYLENQIGYSLVLRLRTNYTLDCIKTNKKWSKRELLKLIKKISGSLSAYQSYLNIKTNISGNKCLPIEEAEKILDYLHKENKKWQKGKKD
jgi:predicted nucleotidyltransferase